MCSAISLATVQTQKKGADQPTHTTRKRAIHLAHWSRFHYEPRPMGHRAAGRHVGSIWWELWSRFVTRTATKGRHVGGIFWPRWQRTFGRGSCYEPRPKGHARVFLLPPTPSSPFLSHFLLHFSSLSLKIIPIFCIISED